MLCCLNYKLDVLLSFCNIRSVIIIIVFLSMHSNLFCELAKAHYMDHVLFIRFPCPLTFTWSNLAGSRAKAYDSYSEDSRFESALAPTTLLSWFSSVFPEEFRDSAFKLFTISSIQMLSKLYLINQPRILNFHLNYRWQNKQIISSNN